MSKTTVTVLSAVVTAFLIAVSNAQAGEEPVEEAPVVEAGAEGAEGAEGAAEAGGEAEKPEPPPEPVEPAEPSEPWEPMKPTEPAGRMQSG